jgi:hypothetical protein
LPASKPRTNDELRRALDIAESAWADCAARVDMIFECQSQALSLTAPDHEQSE